MVRSKHAVVFLRGIALAFGAIFILSRGLATPLAAAPLAVTRPCTEAGLDAALGGRHEHLFVRERDDDYRLCDENCFQEHSLGRRRLVDD